ncbi:hypothetical protein SteCoe_34535 [Stentor coeruleus]|uniref:Arf-GAP domain-containing protein n=1 Tax=Stentor coeruleus TaxID=5963 RepID=A0A1R2AUB3_9CILI|nr:hypothetical protein SteCoe_34535 [Stentor coeruleus]
MDPDVHVDVAYRDSVFKRLKLLPENQFCFDCNLKNPSWCSVILGIFICYNCATPHRSMGTHLSFVRSSELDMWTLRQLAFLEFAGNKKARAFFRSHGVMNAVDYTSQTAERWRNDLSETVNEKYPKKSQNETQKPEPTKQEPKLPTEPIIEEEQKEEKLTPIIKPVQPIIPRSTFKVQSGESKHKFRKTKVDEPQSVSFKPVTFKVQTEEEEFFDPQPLKPPARPKTEILPTPAPAVIQRKPVEKKGISSEDYEAQYVDERAHKNRIIQLSGEKAISSDMFFGREENKNIEITADRIKDEASRIGSIAMDKASQLKQSLSGAFSKLQTRFNSYN